MESKRRIDFVKKEFPAMSAHFAHTLDDMADKYLKINYVNLTEMPGVLNTEDLASVKRSKATVVIYNDIIYKLSKIEDNTYKYIATTEGDDKTAEFDQINVDVSTGVYDREPLFNEIEEAPVDGEVYARKDKAWVKLNNTAIEYSFVSGALDKEEITIADLDAFNKYSNPVKDKIDRKYILNEDSYIWFCSLDKKIDYIAHAGGLEIDYIKQEPDLIVSCGGDKQTWYCYRTTYRLLAGTWNLIIKFVK